MAESKETKLEDMLGPLEEELEFYFSSFLGASYPSIYRKELCWKPPTDVYETESDFVVILELAQMKAEEVAITFQEGILFIRGVRKATPPTERRRYHKMEINYGPFERRIAVPGDVDVENLSAIYEQGFLKIRLPKKKVPPTESVDIEIE
jgi:HSP20 family protein